VHKIEKYDQSISAGIV